MHLMLRGHVTCTDKAIPTFFSKARSKTIRSDRLDKCFCSSFLIVWQIEFAVTDQIKVCLDTTLKSIFHSDATRPSDAVLSFFHCPDAGVSKTPAEFWPTFK